jgi:hypothetical protein
MRSRRCRCVLLLCLRLRLENVPAVFCKARNLRRHCLNAQQRLRNSRSASRLRSRRSAGRLHSRRLRRGVKRARILFRLARTRPCRHGTCCARLSALARTADLLTASAALPAAALAIARIRARASAEALQADARDAR